MYQFMLSTFALVRSKSMYARLLVLGACVASVATAQSTAVVNKLHSETPRAWKKLKEDILQGCMVEIKNTWGPPADNDIGVHLRDKRAGQLLISLRLMRGNELVQIIRNAGKRFVMEGVMTNTSSP